MPKKLPKVEVERRKHLRWAYSNMKRRCYGKSKKDRESSYQQRGITVCDRWLNPDNGKANFMQDMGPSYQIGMTLERLDPYGNYEPSNCSWVPRDKQAANRTNTVWVILDDERMCLKDAARMLGKSYEYLYDLMTKAGMSFEDAVGREPGEYRQRDPVMYHSQEYPSLGNLIRQAGLNSQRQTIYKRIRSGMSVEEAIDTPIRTRSESACRPVDYSKAKAVFVETQMKFAKEVNHPAVTSLSVQHWERDFDATPPEQKDYWVNQSTH